MSLNIRKLEDLGVYICHNSVTGDVFSFIGLDHLMKQLYTRWGLNNISDPYDLFTEEEVWLIAKSDDSIICSSCQRLLRDDEMSNTTCLRCGGEIK